MSECVGVGRREKLEKVKTQAEVETETETVSELVLVGGKSWKK